MKDELKQQYEDAHETHVSEAGMGSIKIFEGSCSCGWRGNPYRIRFNALDEVDAHQAAKGRQQGDG